MINFLEESRYRLVHLLFPFIERFYVPLPLALLVAFWSIPGTYWQIRIILIWLWFVIVEIHSAGIMERDYIPMQPGSSLFYHIYRLIDRLFFLFLLVFLVIFLIPGLLWMKRVFLGLFIIVVILQAMGDRKYRPKKPEE